MSFGRRLPVAFGGVERRRAKRVPVDAPAWLIMGDGPTAHCRLRNLSSTGALVETSTTFGMADTFVMRFADQSRRVRLVWKDRTHVGVAFV